MAVEDVKPVADAAGSYCGHCGGTESADHEACRARLAMEPPRYCAQCRRRMVVQVTPVTWTARCVEHGQLGPAEEKR